MIADDNSAASDFFSGRIILTDLDLKFLHGFRVKDGSLYSRFYKKANSGRSSECNDENWYDENLECHNELEEVIITSRPAPSSNINFIILFDCDNTEVSEESWDYGGGGGGTTTTPIPDEEEAVQVDRTEEFKANDKVNCTYNQLIKGGSIEQILADFFGDEAIFDVTFDVQENLICNGKSNAVGCTTPLGGDAYRITIDLGFINDNTTPTIFLAQTLIHEAIHANLLAAVKKLNNGVVPVDTRFESLWNTYYSKQDPDHEIMATSRYMEMMQKALKQVHPLLNDGRFINNYGELDPSYWNWDKFYESISFRGLHLTEKGKEYYAENEEDISKYEKGAEADSTKEPNCN